MIQKSRAINESASRRSKRQYYGFQFTTSPCVGEMRPEEGFGYIFSTSKERDHWVNLSGTDAAQGLFRQALTRDEARKAYRYGHFVNWEDR